MAQCHGAQLMRTGRKGSRHRGYCAQAAAWLRQDVSDAGLRRIGDLPSSPRRVAVAVVLQANADLYLADC